MTARIHDLGHRPYDGPRHGTAHALRVLVRQGVERAVGRRRPVWSKLLFAATMTLAYLPAVVFVGLAALLSDESLRELVLPTYADYYGFVTAAIVLFTALIAPELVCTDRRNGMLGLYLASPLDRTTYLMARVAAVLLLLAMVTLGPPLLLLVAYTLQGAGPDGVSETIETFLRIVGAAAVVTVVPTALSIAVSSFTDRRAAASAGIILSLLVSGAFVGGLVENGNAPDALGVFSLIALPFEAAQRVYGERGDGGPVAEVGTPLVLAAVVAWTLALGTAAWWRYQRLEVRR